MSYPQASDMDQPQLVNPADLSLRGINQTDTDGDSTPNSNGQSNSNSTMDPRVFLGDLKDEDDDLMDDDYDGISGDESWMSRRDTPPPRKKLLPTGVCYDDRMTYHANADFSDEQESHPEDPRRIMAIFDTFKKAGLVYQGSDHELRRVLQEDPMKWMWRICARVATKEEICTAHGIQHYNWVKDLESKTQAELRQLTAECDIGRKSLYVGNLTFVAATVAVGGAIETCKHVLVGNVKNAIAVIRPPGHHAESHESLGFCLFNNVSVAAKICMADYPDICKKVLILDWDVHHGNGIQDMFYEDPNVLYISIHVWKNGEFYPNTPADPSIPGGGIESVGRGPGIGKNINIAWEEQGMNDGDYLAAFQKIVMPIAMEFAPDLVIVAAGFDAAVGDELGGCYVTPACYSHMTHMLMSLADGKVAVCLEGGYNLTAISLSALAVAKTLMGEPPERICPIPPVNRAALKVFKQVQQQHAPYWKCMQGTEVRIDGPQVTPSTEVVRRHQGFELASKYRMINTYIYRGKLVGRFHNQVMHTRDLHSAKKILVIIHDPPELVGFRDTDTLQFQPHNSKLIDPVAPYIQWAYSDGFAIMDICVPRRTTSSGLASPPNDAEEELGAYLNELMVYLWDNHLELSESNAIVLLGVGEAYLGIKQLLLSRDCSQRIAGILAFTEGDLRGLTQHDDSLKTWYKNNSLIYVCPNHACWSDEKLSKKVSKKRFGHVVRADREGQSAMMHHHFKDATEWIAEQVREDEEMEESG